MTRLEVRDLTHDIDLDRQALDEITGGGVVTGTWKWIKGKANRFYTRFRRGNYGAAFSSINPFFSMSRSSRRRDFRRRR